MISRITIFSLLLGLMLGLGIYMWSSGHRDACSAYLDGNTSAQKIEYVSSGSRLIAVPCKDWSMRQPLPVQLLCLLGLCFAVVFVFSALGNLNDWMIARRRFRSTR